MQKKNKYDLPYQGALIELKRKYSKDEYVAHLMKTITEKDIEIGMFKSETEEYKYNIQELKKSVLSDNGIKVTEKIKKRKLYQKILKSNHRLQTENNKWKKTRDELIAKIIKLENR
jgi:hypothetical protein